MIKLRIKKSFNARFNGPRKHPDTGMPEIIP